MLYFYQIKKDDLALLKTFTDKYEKIITEIIRKNIKNLQDKGVHTYCICRRF